MKSVEKLREDSVAHLQYEVRMMQDTAQRLLHDRKLHDDPVLKNATVESCVVHARSLTGFIYADNAHTDDITSDDYVIDKPAWATARGPEPPPILVTLNIRTAKEIAHLTTKRLGADDPAKSWPLVEIIDALHVLLKKFVTHVATDRLHLDVSRFIIGLRPPMRRRRSPSTTLGLPASSLRRRRCSRPTFEPWCRSLRGQDHPHEEGEAHAQRRRFDDERDAGAMRPFDLLPGNPADWLYADLRRPAEMRERESYLSNPRDPGDYEHVDRIEQQAQPTEPLPPSGRLIANPAQWSQYRRRPQVWLHPGVPLPLSAAAEDVEPPPPGSRLITIQQRPQQRSQTWLFPGVPE